jgi:hypothetical protein
MPSRPVPEESVEEAWPAAYKAHRIKGQPMGPFLFKDAQTLPDNVAPELLETEVYVPESAFQAEAEARDKVEAERDQARKQVLEEVREGFLAEMEKARQANVKPNAIEGDLFGDLLDEDHAKADLTERRIISGVQVVALADFNAALDRVCSLHPRPVQGGAGVSGVLACPAKVDDDRTLSVTGADGRGHVFDDFLYEGELVCLRSETEDPPYGRVVRKDDGLWIVALTEFEEAERSRSVLAASQSKGGGEGE